LVLICGSFELGPHDTCSNRHVEEDSQTNVPQGILSREIACWFCIVFPHNELRFLEQVLQAFVVAASDPNTRFQQCLLIHQVGKEFAFPLVKSSPIDTITTTRERRIGFTRSSLDQYRICAFDFVLIVVVVVLLVLLVVVVVVVVGRLAHDNGLEVYAT